MEMEMSFFAAPLLCMTFVRKKGMTTSCKTIFDGPVKSLLFVMPDLIRHPELVEFTGFRLPPE
jgi:hypothetical protein